MLDKQFIVGATSIGTVYALVITAVQHFAGPNASGVVGVALSGLALAILKEFEKLRFKREIAEGRVIEIPRFQIAYLFLLMSALIGLQVVMGVIVAAITMARGGLSSLMSLSSRLMANDTKLAVEMVALTAFAYFLGGLLIGRTSPRPLIYAIVGTLLVNILFLIAFVVPDIIQDRSKFKVFLHPSTYTFGAYWLGFMLAAMIGARMGRPKRKATISAAQRPSSC